MPTPVAGLKIARGLINKGWAQQTNARDKYGHAVDVTDQNATCFCMYGACVRAFSDRFSPDFDRAREALRETIVATTGKQLSIPTFNDYEAFYKETVLGVFDRTIARLEHSV